MGGSGIEGVAVLLPVTAEFVECGNGHSCRIGGAANVVE